MHTAAHRIRSFSSSVAMIEPSRPRPALLETIVYSSSLLSEVSSIMRWLPIFSGKTGHSSLCYLSVVSFPPPVAAQMTFILTPKQITVCIKESFRRAVRNRVSVQAYLLDKATNSFERRVLLTTKSPRLETLLTVSTSIHRRRFTQDFYYAS